MRTLGGQEGVGVNFSQFGAYVFYGQSLMKLQAAKNVLWTRISI